MLNIMVTAFSQLLSGSLDTAYEIHNPNVTSLNLDVDIVYKIISLQIFIIMLQDVFPLQKLIMKNKKSQSATGRKYKHAPTINLITPSFSHK